MSGYPGASFACMAIKGAYCNYSNRMVDPTYMKAVTSTVILVSAHGWSIVFVYQRQDTNSLASVSVMSLL